MKVLEKKREFNQPEEKGENTKKGGGLTLSRKEKKKKVRF